MSERGNSDEFRAIMRASFPDGGGKQFSITPATAPTQEQSTKRDRERWMLICAASQDERIADYYLEEAGDYNFLISQLATDFALSIDEAKEAMHRGLGLISQVLGYDEA